MGGMDYVREVENREGVVREGGREGRWMGGRMVEVGGREVGRVVGRELVYSDRR